MTYLLLANPPVRSSPPAPEKVLGDHLIDSAKTMPPVTRQQAEQLAARLVSLRDPFEKAGTLGELAKFLLARERASDQKQLATLEWWIDYCESAVVATLMKDKYADTVEKSAYRLDNIELDKGQSEKATQRDAVTADFGLEQGRNSASGDYHWAEAPNYRIDIVVTAPNGDNAALGKPVLLQSVTELSTLHLIGSFTRPGLDVLGSKLDLVGARVWWPERPTPQDMLVASVAEHVPRSRWAAKGAKPFKSTFEDYIDKTDQLLGPFPPPLSWPPGERQVDPSWTPYDVGYLDKVPTLKYFRQGVDSYEFTKNAIKYFAQGNLVYASNDYKIPESEDWKPRTLMNTIEKARKECVEKLVDIDKLRTEWFNARDAFRKALKRFLLEKGYSSVRDDSMSTAEWLRIWTSAERFRTWNSRREALLEAAALFEAQGDGKRLHEAATTASRRLATARHDWNKAASLRLALEAWDSFIRGDMTLGFSTLSRGLPLSTRELWEILQSPMALFHFEGKERDVLIRADYFHLYEFTNSGALSLPLGKSSLGVEQIGLCGATGHAMGAHLHVQTQWCYADKADAAACLNASDKTTFVQWITNATKAPALPSGKKAPGTWRKMPAAFLFPKKG